MSSLQQSTSDVADTVLLLPECCPSAPDTM